MLYKNISNRTIRVRNVILKPNEQFEFKSDLSHVKTFLRMNWLVAVQATPVEAAKPEVVEAAKSEPLSEPKVVPAEEVTFKNDPAPDHPYPVVEDAKDPTPVPEDAPVIVTEEPKHGRGRGKGK